MAAAVNVDPEGMTLVKAVDHTLLAVVKPKMESAHFLFDLAPPMVGTTNNESEGNDETAATLQRKMQCNAAFSNLFLMCVSSDSTMTVTEKWE